MEQATLTTPKSHYEISKGMAEMASENGLVVGYYDFDPSEKTPKYFFQLMRVDLSKKTESFQELPDKPNTFRIKLNTQIPKELLSKIMRYPVGETQDFLNLIRGIIYYGLDKGIIKNAITSQGEYITTYAVNSSDRELIIRNVNHPSDLGTFLEFELNLDYTQLLKEILSRPIEQDYEEIFAKLSGSTDETTRRIIRALAKELPEDDVLIQSQEKSDAAETKAETSPEVETTISPAPETTPAPTLDIEVTDSGAKPNHDVDSLFEAALPSSTLQSELLKKFNSIQIPQPPLPTIDREQRVIQKELEPTTEAKLQEIEKQLPALRQAVETLDNATAITSEPEKEIPENDPVRKYIDWRTSDKYYEVAKTEAGYLTGRHLVEIIAENTEADANIAVVDTMKETTPAEKEYEQLYEQLKNIANRGRSDDEQVDDFEIVLEPNPRQFSQLALLRDFIGITTGVILPKEFGLFVYKGTGSKGINIGAKGIGIHEELLRVTFREAEGTFEHEVSHNYSLKHDLDFIRAQQSMADTVKGKLLTVIDKQAKGSPLTDEEATIVDIQNTWNKLRV